MRTSEITIGDDYVVYPHSPNIRSQRIYRSHGQRVRILDLLKLSNVRVVHLDAEGRVQEVRKLPGLAQGLFVATTEAVYASAHVQETWAAWSVWKAEFDQERLEAEEEEALTSSLRNQAHHLLGLLGIAACTDTGALVIVNMEDFVGLLETVRRPEVQAVIYPRLPATAAGRHSD